MRGRLAAFGILAAMLCGCGQQPAPQQSQPAAAPSTTTASVPTQHAFTVKMSHHFKPYDGSGIGRDNNETGSACGPWTIAKQTDRLVFLVAGSDVLLKDQKGTILAKAQLGTGRTSNAQENNEFDCTWTIEFGPVDETAFYQVSLGAHDLGTISLDEAKASAWTVSTTIT